MENIVRKILSKETHEKYSRELMVRLYREKFIQTLWNTADEKKRHEGWILKDGSWSPWFFNMRPIGSSPGLSHLIYTLMGNLVWGASDYFKLNGIVGIEMAGIPLAGAVGFYCAGRNIKHGYTRPLPAKARTLAEAAQIYDKIWYDDPQGYGQKSWVEMRLVDGDSLAVIDDMSTGLESKLIARYMVLKEAAKNDIALACDHIFYFLNRNKGAAKKGLDFAKADPAHFPAPLHVHYFLEFEDQLEVLQKEMKSEEYECIAKYQSDKSIFQGYSKIRADAIGSACCK